MTNYPSGAALKLKTVLQTCATHYRAKLAIKIIAEIYDVDAPTAKNWQNKYAKQPPKVPND